MHLNISTATVGPPSFTLVGLDARDGPFVVAAVDPDAPTPQNPTNAQVRHFLGGNFEPSRLSRSRATLTNTTAAVSNWRQPTPPAGSDAHRCVHLNRLIPIAVNSYSYLEDMFFWCSISHGVSMAKHSLTLPHLSHCSTSANLVQRLGLETPLQEHSC